MQSCFPSWSIDIPHVLFLVSKFRFYFIKVLRKIISWFRSLNEFSTAINLSQGWRCRTGSSAALLTSTEQDQPLLARPHLPVSLCGIQCCWNISAWRRAGPPVCFCPALTCQTGTILPKPNIIHPCGTAADQPWLLSFSECWSNEGLETDISGLACGKTSGKILQACRSEKGVHYKHE